MLSNITFLSFLLFLMCHSIHVAVNTWLNCSFFYINICCFVIIHRNADTNKGIWIYIFFTRTLPRPFMDKTCIIIILARSRDVIEHNFLMTTWYPYTICYRCSIVTESVSPAVCEILSPKQIGVTTHIWLQIYRGHVLDLLGSRDVIGQETIWCPI